MAAYIITNGSPKGGGLGKGERCGNAGGNSASMKLCGY